MSRAHRRPLTPSSQGASAFPSKFKEHLSIAVPRADPPIERSRFSPDSPTSRAFSIGRPTPLKSLPRSRPIDPEKGFAGKNGSSSQGARAQPSVGERFGHLFVDLRGSRKDDPSVPPIAPVVLPKIPETWRVPLDDRKPEALCPCHAKRPPTRMERRYHRVILSALVVFLLYLFVNVIVLNVRSFASSYMAGFRSSTVSSSSAPTMTGVMLSADTQRCITQYSLNAPADPKGYPCSSCLPLLVAVPPNATAVYAVARDGTQFCGLRSIWEAAGQQGEAALEAGGWVKDVKFCAWNGVRCDGAGRVSSLQLTSPAIPASLPAQFTNLTELESLEIVGDGTSPAGSFPTSFGDLTKLTTLHFENTALGALPDTLQTLSALTLVRNAQVGPSLPPSIASGALRSLIVNNEPLTLSATQSAALCSKQLQNCDLRGSGSQACGACLVG
ncbi:hypothetical protein F5148DRAFT_1170625 [Russula earlei]|uniref:Uncharacterized protein n=1 Tax=Russula earlei TaxID=71964 RepID=A0ACC0UKW0_9AGAM|nr:hypothetical protein F5148DRAFT_1170625 [Russula earlei]